MIDQKNDAVETPQRQNIPGKIKTKLKSLSGLAKNVIRQKRYRYPLLGLLSTACLAYGVVFFIPRQIVFSFAGGNCITNPVIFPGLVSDNLGETFHAHPKPSLAVSDFSFYSHRTCISPSGAPAEKTTETIPFGNMVFKKDIHVQVKKLPSIPNTKQLVKPIPTKKPLILPLDSHDQVFDYQLYADKKKLMCDTREASIFCDVADLKLAQSTKYKFKLERLFENSSQETLFNKSLKTVQSVKVVGSSVNKDQIVFHKPRKVTLTLNRKATKAGDVRLFRLSDNKRVEIPAQTNLDKKKLTVRFDKHLPRQAKFILNVARTAAQDGGFMERPFALKFNTSGGPKVLGASIDTYKVPLSSDIVVNFDSPVLGSQPLQDFIQLKAGDKPVDASVYASGNSVVISPSSPLPRCAPLTVQVLDGLKSSYGVSGGSGWRYESRTICQIIFNIGTSVEGRGLTVYKFGSGPSKIIYVGGTHGNEKSSYYTLDSWVDYLERNGNIPAKRTIIVIPDINPDGFARGSRTNARNVDLNRNFPADNWKKNVTMPDLSVNKGGGGSKPLSEPESRALANYVISQSPRAVLTYHAAAGVVIPNGSGDSSGLSKTYAANSNLSFAPNNQTNQLFPYDTTGAFEDWLHDKHGIPTLLVELWTVSGNEFEQNRAAMWAIANLP